MTHEIISRLIDKMYEDEEELKKRGNMANKKREKKTKKTVEKLENGVGKTNVQDDEKNVNQKKKKRWQKVKKQKVPTIQVRVL